MGSLSTEINNFMKQIDKLTIILLGQDEREPIQLLAAITEPLNKVFPLIVASYERPELADKKEEQTYWIEQLKRISQAMSGDDRFFAIDILYFELRENLIQYQNMMNTLGLEI